MEAKDKIDPRYIKVAISLAIFGAIVWAFSYVDDYTISLLLSYLLLYRYVMIFIVAFLAGVMIPLPVNIMLLAVGSFTGVYFNFTIALFVAGIANSLGDLCSFLFFRKFGHRILHDKYVEKYKFFLDLESYFGKHVNLSIFISRIIGLFSTPVDFLSGYTKVAVSRFAFFALVGELAFAFIFLSIGQFVGEKWINASDGVSYVTWGLAIILIIYIVRTIFKKEDTEVREV